MNNKNGSKYGQANRLSKRISVEVNRLIYPENSHFSIRKENHYNNHYQLDFTLLKVIIFGRKSARVIVESVVVKIFKVKDEKQLLEDELPKLIEIERSYILINQSLYLEK